MTSLVGFCRGLAVAIVALTLAAPASAQVSTFDLSGNGYSEGLSDEPSTSRL
jgi:hypothetical protein